MKSRRTFASRMLAGIAIGVGSIALVGYAQQATNQPPSSYSPVVAKEPFEQTMSRMSDAKAEIMKRQMDLLGQRYDLSDRPAQGVTMSRGRPVQEGVRVRLPKGITWQQLATMSPQEIREKDLWPAGFYPLPHPNHPEGGMVFPQSHLDELKRQTDRDLTRFDLDFDLPDHLLADFPPAIFLTTRPDLGDVS
jgi:cytochrome c peroxidase